MVSGGFFLGIWARGLEYQVKLEYQGKSSRDVRFWKTTRFELSLAHPLVMGIVNVTPDSFSDGGKFFHTLKAIDHARQLLESGANILDVGGESTRPGAAGVDVDEEWARVSDVLRELISWNVPVSIDTMKATVMARAVDLGVDILNDVNGFRDEGAEQVLTQSAAGAVVMHMNGEPRTMQEAPEYSDLLGEIAVGIEFADVIHD